MDLRVIPFIFDDDEEINIINTIIGPVLELAEPLPNLESENRAFIPKNENFYENTIPLDMGDLFKEHFRMSRTAFDVCTLYVYIYLFIHSFLSPKQQNLLVSETEFT